MSTNIKPTAADAIKYLAAVLPDEKFHERDGRLWCEHPTGPIQFAFVEEFHWLKGGIVGARGIPLWNVTPIGQQLEQLLKARS